MLYCIRVTREFDDPSITHCEFKTAPEPEQVLQLVLEADLNYDDDYGKIEYWEVRLGVWR